MTVTLDALAEYDGPEDTLGRGPIWRVACDHGDCHHRLYVEADDEVMALGRVKREYGWLCGERVLCRTHGSPR